MQSGVLIYDQENVIEDTTEKRLNQLLVSLKRETSVEFAVVSVPTLMRMSIEDYSIELANRLGIGKNLQTTEFYLLNDAKCGRIGYA